MWILMFPGSTGFGNCLPTHSLLADTQHNNHPIGTFLGYPDSIRPAETGKTSEKSASSE